MLMGACKGKNKKKKTKKNKPTSPQTNKNTTTKTFQGFLSVKKINQTKKNP